MDEDSVFTEVADQWMVLFKSDLGLDFLGLEQRPNIPQAPGAFGQSPLAGAIDGRKRMALDQADQPHQRAHAANAAVLGDGPAVFGRPYVEGAKIEATVVRHGKEKKIRVFKFKPKKRYRKTIGHRQDYTEIKIEKITAG